MAGKKPYVVVVLIQFLFAGMAILSKVAFDGGMNTFVFVFYRQAIAAVLLTPTAIFFERFIDLHLYLKFSFQMIYP